MDKRLNGKFKEWVDIIGYATYDISTSEQREGFNKRVSVNAKTDTVVDDKTKEAIRRTRRVIYLSGSHSIVAKARAGFGLPDKLALNGKNFFDLLNARFTSNITKDEVSQ